MYNCGMSGKAERYAKACGIGAEFPDLETAEMWARIGQDVTGGSWVVRRTPTGWAAISPSEQARQLQPA